MRLVCPSCEAKYEVPDDAIPDTGRDVQCANCGHAWFQTRSRAVSATTPLAAVPESVPSAEPVPESAAEPEIAAATIVTDQVDAAVAEAIASDTKKSDKKAKAKAAEAALAMAIAEPDPEPEPATSPAEPPTDTSTEPEVTAPAVDEKVLTILREEAEREAKARRGENLPVETQPDLGIVAASANRKKGATKKQEAPEEAEKASARRDLLPDVEEINSTLRPSEEPEPEFVGGPLEANIPAARGGFRSGFMLVISLALLGSALYISAGRLSLLVPAISEPLSAYVGFVDGLRLSLDGLMQSATKLISGDSA